MPQSTIIATGTTSLSSSNVDVAVGSTVTVGLFSATDIGDATYAVVRCKTPSADIDIGSLSKNSPIMQLNGPITVVVHRPAQTQSVGVFLNT